MTSPSLLIATMCLAESLSMLGFATYPTLLPEFQAEWGLSNTEAGWISGVYFSGYVVAVGVLTALTDRVDPKQIYLFSMAVSILAPLGFAFTADGVWSASLWRMLQGLGLAGTYMPGLKALTDVLPQRLHSRAVAFYTSSFGLGASASMYLSGIWGAAYGWHWAFMLCSLGPALGFVVAAFVLKSRPPVKHKLTTRLLDFRPVLRNRRALGFTLTYAAHNAELFGMRSWIVAFLVFSQAQQAPDALGLAWSAATIAALFNLCGMPASVLTNEAAARFGREPVLIVVMSLSALMAVILGLSSSAVFGWVVLLGLLYGVLVMADSATITAGLVAAAEPRYRGTTMAMYSLIGFLGAFIGPIVFGLVLDLAGGETTTAAWTWAFASMGAMVLLGPLIVTKLVRETV